MIVSLSLVFLLFTSSAFAAPGQYCCDISNTTLQLPANQTQLVAPAGSPSYIALGVGVQNYTCSSSSNYTSAGAVAELYDLSCATQSSCFADIQDHVYKALSSLPPGDNTTSYTTLMTKYNYANVLGQHYFVTNPITGVGISPKWDFTSSGKTAGNANAFVIGAKVGDIAAPTGSDDVDWLSLKAVKGELASQIFRVDTKGGQPPASCTPGSAPISVPYTAKYWLYGGTVKD